MRPPICAVCGERFEAQEGGTVRFADFKPLPDGMVGHPPGLVWFCGQHIVGAKTLDHLKTEVAVVELRKNSVRD